MPTAPSDPGAITAMAEVLREMACPEMGGADRDRRGHEDAEDADELLSRARAKGYVLVRERDLRALLDTEYEEVVLAGVVPTNTGYELRRADGWVFHIPDPGWAPEEGQRARFYGEGIGRIVRGVSVEGRVVFHRTPEEQAAENARLSAEFAEKRRLAMLEPKIPEVATPGFEWEEGLAEISGFGGGYERACRRMVSQGCAWWAAHPDADPRFRGFQGIIWVLAEDNEDAKALSAAITEGVPGGPTGAMHQAAVGHVMRWKELGSWDAYQEWMRGRAGEGERADG